MPTTFDPGFQLPPDSPNPYIPYWDGGHYGGSGGGAGGGMFNPSAAFGFGGGPGVYGFNSTYPNFQGFSPNGQRRRAGYTTSAPSPAQTSMSALRAPQMNAMSPTSAQTGGPPSGAPAASGPPQFSNPWDIIAWHKAQSAAGAAKAQTPASDVDLLLAGLGQGPWSPQGDPRERAAMEASANARALDMQHSALLGAQIDTQDPWLRAFANIQGRNQGQRAAADTYRQFDTDQASFLRDLRAQLLMAKLGQYYQKQNQPKDHSTAGLLGGLLGVLGGGILGNPNTKIPGLS